MMRLRDGLMEARHVLGGPNVRDGHREKFLHRVAVVRDCRIVDGEEAQRLEVVYPHGMGIGLEHLPKLMFSGQQFSVGCIQIQGLLFELAEQGGIVLLQHHRLIRRHGAGTTDDSPFGQGHHVVDAAQERRRLGRLGQKRVRSEIEGQDFVVRLGIRGGVDDERHVRRGWIGTPASQ
jgi:hypothetical protein